MTTTKQFASEYERNDSGWILFPNDVARRKELFVPESMKHTAKANIYMVEELVKYTSEPGDVVLDIFGGTGTLLVGMYHGRHVGLIEMNPVFQDVIIKNIGKWQDVDTGVRGILHEVPCQLALTKIRNVQAIITSPPYSQAFSKGSGTFKEMSETELAYRESMNTYADDSQVRGNLVPYNLATMSNFRFNKEMELIYKLSYESIKQGGYFALIIKDRIQKGVREELGMANLRMLLKAGFKLDKWERWLPPGTRFAKQAHAKGQVWVDEEHLIIVRKP